MTTSKEWEHPLFGIPEGIAVSELICEDSEVMRFIASLARERFPMLSCLSDWVLVRLFACAFCRKDYEHMYSLIVNAVFKLKPEALVELRVTVGLPHFKL